jgi:hypothetical protein
MLFILNALLILARHRSVRTEENPTWAANWVLLSSRPAPRPSSRFARHSHDSRRGIRPDVLHRVLQLVHVHDREMGRYPPTKVDRRHKLGKCRTVQTRMNISRMRRVSLFLIVQLMPYDFVAQRSASRETPANLTVPSLRTGLES